MATLLTGLLLLLLVLLLLLLMLLLQARAGAVNLRDVERVVGGGLRPVLVHLRVEVGLREDGGRVEVGAVRVRLRLGRIVQGAGCGRVQVGAPVQRELGHVHLGCDGGLGRGRTSL
uniref:(northern house mosquito) hypothetical protein n=1 Tax=Culex pipiens TaxID=7175 RepID=A0A8D8F8S7_CULPI